MALDKFTWFSSGEGCRNNNCSALGQDLNASCRCEIDEAFLIKNIDDDKVFFHHGYSVNYEDTTGHGSRVTKRIKVDSSNPRIKTKVVKTDGSDCSIGGKTIWNHEDARNGLGGTVSEWLECGGFHLDRTLQDTGGDAIHDK
eukprot:CAMPEP_0172837634 /NCGR_PEP_ID=MMETSP1075-20121228/27346_1 /TAXON_ID=2916 /ORGANISM="Ceratium fusus, Strain PA161109" /LENGTH=141 /DNA_ID=CAMNT_0013681051 /DNA_START=64 /DNA_END=486 /DNA_ORIENTATION=-